jgi:hypothetical protein
VVSGKKRPFCRAGRRKEAEKAPNPVSAKLVEDPQNDGSEEQRELDFKKAMQDELEQTKLDFDKKFDKLAIKEEQAERVQKAGAGLGLGLIQVAVGALHYRMGNTKCAYCGFFLAAVFALLAIGHLGSCVYHACTGQDEE